MNSDELRRSLLNELKVVEKRVRADLLAQYRTDPALMERAMQRLREEENSPADRVAWLETFAGRGAVLYILKTLYVRVLEDQGLLSPIRIRDGGTYALFRSLFPQLGHAAYLRRVFDDAERALPELFAPTLVEIATPSGEAASLVWDVWQLAAPGGGPRFDFRGPELDTRFIGDLYQDLDPEVSDRYALFQTPRFIEEFILDRTLDPALAQFGLVDFRLIDPTCGSGHFLVGAFERIARAWRTELGNSANSRWLAAEKALSAVYGADLNEYACAISRFRLLLSVVKETGIVDLKRLHTLHLNIIVCDSLVPWERITEMLPGTASSDASFARYGTEAERIQNTAFFARGYHAVVGNPPYKSVKDKKKRKDYRLAWPRSASGKYSLSAPMTERFLLLPLTGGRSGFITANNFAKREFGYSLVTKVLPDIQLDLIVDSSGAYIPEHGTPTVMIFSTNQTDQQASPTVLIVARKRGEPKPPPDPAQGIVWSSIRDNWNRIDYEDTKIAVLRVDKSRLTTHPWVLGNRAALRLYDRLSSSRRLSEIGASAGPAVIISEDEAFVRRYSRSLPLRPIVFGEDVRDWQIRSRLFVASPLDGDLDKIEAAASIDLWHVRAILWNRPTFAGETYRDSPNEKHWWQFHQVVSSRTKVNESRVVFADIGTNSYFAIDRSTAVFTQHAPVLTIPSANESDYYHLAGFLNSSTLEFWFKQVCFDRGNGGIHNGIAADDWEKFFERNSTNVLEAPFPPPHAAPEALSIHRQSALSMIEDTLHELAACEPARVFDSAVSVTQSLAAAQRKTEMLREQLISLQEEIDWNIYGTFDLVKDVPLSDLSELKGVARGHRPFEIVLARRIERGEEESAWFRRHGLKSTTEVPAQYVGAQRELLERRIAFIENQPTINLLEQPVYKRRWTFESWEMIVADAAQERLLEELEAIVRNAPVALTVADIFSLVSSDARIVAIAAYAKTAKDESLADTVARLLTAESIPDNPARLFTRTGLAKLIGTQTADLGSPDIPPVAKLFAPGEDVSWKRVWRLQEREDAKLGISAAVPSSFVRTDYAHPNGWRIRDKFNIANERFIVYDELTPKRYAWGGHTIAERARLSAEAFDLRGRQAQDDAGPPASVQPTRESPLRCGIQFPLWDKLDELRRLADPNYADVRELAMLCGRTCPCDVLDSWRDRTMPVRGKRPSAGKRVVHTTPIDEAKEPELDAALLDRVFEAISRAGESHATAALLEVTAGGDRELLRRALEALRTDGRIELRGRGRSARYRISESRLL